MAKKISRKAYFSSRIQRLVEEHRKARPIPRYTDDKFRFRGPKKADGTGGQRISNGK